MTPEQVRMGRAALNWSLDDLASSAAVSRNTVQNLELGRSVRVTTQGKIRDALESAGVTFSFDEGVLTVYVRKL